MVRRIAAMTIKELKIRMVIARVRAGRVAVLLGISETYLCKILSGERPTPDNFFTRASAAVKLLEIANASADDARARVLKQWQKIDKRYK